jgi:hypothetical protein
MTLSLIDKDYHDINTSTGRIPRTHITTGVTSHQHAITTMHARHAKKMFVPQLFYQVRCHVMYM